MTTRNHQAEPTPATPSISTPQPATAALGQPGEVLRPGQAAPALDLRDPEQRARVRGGLWVELRLQTDLGAAIADERCLVIWPPGHVLEGRTDERGVLRFSGLSLDPAVHDPASDRPLLVLPDILEAWSVDDLAPSQKDAGAPLYRGGDHTVHPLPWQTALSPVVVDRLTEEAKFQHFYRAHVDHGARYDSGKGSDYMTRDRRWSWSKGSVCNQHVNFFLGYWFNYNALFTTRGSGTFMINLPLYDSAVHDFRPIGTQDKDPRKNTAKETVKQHHRGYREFLTPVVGFGVAARETYDPDDPNTIPRPGAIAKAAAVTEYIRLSELYTIDGSPRPTLTAFMRALGDFNVYSVADIHDTPRHQGQLAKALELTRAWLHEHAAAKQLDAKKIAAMKDRALWAVIWDLRRDVAPDDVLWARLRGLVDFDHHAGILLRRGPDGGDPAGVPEAQHELWTFSADGAKKPGPPLVMKRLADVVVGSHFKHLAIWTCKPLRPGGGAPEDAAGNAGGVPLTALPRFIRWLK